MNAPNLTQRPPRSPRVRLGGYVILARILDKGRAELAGTAGEYKYNNPMDRHWFRFTGITPEALKAELAAGKGDGEILAWTEEHATPNRGAWDIQTATGGGDALQRLRAAKVDLVVIDVFMPGMDGLQLLRVKVVTVRLAELLQIR